MPKTEIKININIGSIVNEYIKQLQFDLYDTIKNENINSNLTTWKPYNSKTSFVFKFPPKKNSMTDMFIKYVVRRQRRNLPATKRDFYKTVLGYKINVGNLSKEEFINTIIDNELKKYVPDNIKKHYETHVYNPITNKMIDLNGHNSKFFSTITDSGILSRDGQFYTIGPNYNSWINGNLKKEDYN
jgi:hypothetical protein